MLCQNFLSLVRHRLSDTSATPWASPGKIATWLLPDLAPNK
jgi:hypothetical protein